jgi:hypothetical protein
MLMANKPTVTTVGKVEWLILTKLNQALKRNAERFHEDFAFQLGRQEYAALTSQSVMSKRQLMELTANDQPRREIGFHVRELAPPYRVRTKQTC